MGQTLEGPTSSIKNKQKKKINDFFFFKSASGKIDKEVSDHRWYTLMLI